jgi:hypothetical protein
MLTVCRNVLIAVGGLLGAALLAALVQGVLQYTLPSSSAKLVGVTDVSTYALLVVLGCSFLAFGAAAPRWLQSSAPLLWLLIPIIAVYAVAIVGQPYVYRCNPVASAACGVILSPFFVSAAAVVAGWAFQRRRASALRARAGQRGF